MASPAWKHARVAGEDLLDRVGVGEHHPRALVRDPQREHVAVAALAVLEHRARAGIQRTVWSGRGVVGPGGIMAFTYRMVSECRGAWKRGGRAPS